MTNPLDVIVNFIIKYFIDPIRHHTGYNVINTLTYAIILVIGVYYILKLLEKLDIKVNKKFTQALIPFMIFGGACRALVDASVYPDTFLLITPGIYFTITIITMTSLLLARTLSSRKDWEFERSLQYIGISLATINMALVILNIERAIAIAYILGFFALFYVPIIMASAKFPNSFLKGNEYIVGAHIFDASTTFCGIYFYGYVEQHVLTGFFIDIFGPFVMFPLKIVFITLSLYLLEWIVPESDIETLNIKNILKMVIIVLGLGPGIRNMSTILMGA
ncbi:MAG: DUF63 family protein [Candidatus Methanofastidiosia archaeon]